MRVHLAKVDKAVEFIESARKAGGRVLSLVGMGEIAGGFGAASTLYIFQLETFVKYCCSSCMCDASIFHSCNLSRVQCYSFGCLSDEI